MSTHANRYRVIPVGREFHLIDTDVPGRTLTLYVDRSAAESDAELLNGSQPLSGRTMALEASSVAHKPCVMPSRSHTRVSRARKVAV
jgi:hypothetical protein